MYVYAVRFNTPASVFHRLWITPTPPAQAVDKPVDNFLEKNRGRTPLSALIQTNLICPLINLYLTLRHLRAICPPTKLLTSNNGDPISY
jgi:hypothetical protein